MPVLPIFDFVPALSEMLNDIQNDWTDKSHVDIVPRHTSAFKSAYGVACEFSNFLEVRNTGVVVVLPSEERTREFHGMDVRQGMVVGIPSSEAQVQATNSSKVVVDNNDLFVVGPELDAVLGTDVVGVAKTSNVGV